MSEEKQKPQTIESAPDKPKTETIVSEVEAETLSSLIGEQPRETYWGDVSKRVGGEYLVDSTERAKTKLLEITHPHEQTGEQVKTRMLLLEGGKLYPRMLSDLGFTDEQAAMLIDRGVKIDVLMTNFEDAVLSAERTRRAQDGSVAYMQPNEIEQDEDLQREKVRKLLGGLLDEEDSERYRMSLTEQNIPTEDGDKTVTEIIAEKADRIVLFLGHGGPDDNKDKTMGTLSREKGHGLHLADAVQLYQETVQPSEGGKLCVLDCGCTGEAMVTIPTSLVESDTNFMFFAARGDISLRDNNGVYMVDKQDGRLSITTGSPNPNTVTFE